MFNDLINGTFELAGGILCWLNVLKLRTDKEVRGIHWGVQVFFAAWGWWNLYYYPSLSQWLSFTGGLILASGTTAWVVLALKYMKQNRKASS